VARAAAAEAQSPQGQTGLPFIGETLDILNDPIGYFDQRTKQYGKVFRTRFAGEDCVAVADTKLIQELLNSEHKTVIFEINPSIDKLAESPMFASNERRERNVQKEHKLDRAFLKDFFSPAAIASYYPYMQSSLRKRMASWAEQPEVPVVEATKAFAFDVMNTQLAGIRFTEEQLREMDDLWKDFTNGAMDLLGIDLPWTDFGKGVRAAERLEEIILAALRESYGDKMDTRDFGERNIATGFLMQKNEDGSWKHSLENVASIMKALLFAGHETTAGAMLAMMHFITRNPEVLTALREEQAELVERHGTEITPEILEGTYTEATTVEVMRLQNIDKTTRSPGLLFRRAISDFELGGYSIKKGTKIMLAQVYSTYSVEKFLPTVEQFQPERWLVPGKSAVATSKSVGVSAFGGGPRVCAGEALAWAELKVFLSMLVRNLDWEILNPDAEWRKSQGSINRTPVDGMATRFVKRAEAIN